ncbi:tetratricopeptide repeat protein [Chitinophaga qingshengii]|uniref:Tetratricopeptide repeat protein n=1 Tax=Chitinophaga qingshengii TaxID=1569794 RepID=A0ABR7TI74_9BACT|nr:tetratricopeptide repeat protein [Chitinophaga qingshengii]MBC9929658.1 tetratricopeptide repeat protein [Chitinophaga qingshengii]
MKYLPILVVMAGVVACNNDHKKPEQQTSADSALYSDIIRPVTDSIQQYPDQDALYYRRALLLFNTNPALARLDFEKAATLKPGNPDYWAGAGEAALLENHYDKAELYFSKALANAPTYTYLQYKLATAMVENKHTVQADSLANVLAGSADGKDKAFYLKARMAEDRQDTTAAIAHLKTAVAAAGPRAEFEAVMELADLLRARKTPEAVQYYTQAWRQDTLNAAPLYDAGQVQEEMGNTDAAMNTYRKCIVADPGFAEAYLAMGRIYSARKQWKDAYEAYNLAAKSAPSSALAYFNRARCQEELGNKQEALADYTKASTFRKDYKEAREAIQRLSR